MRAFARWVSLCCFGLLGCTSDERVICERLEECSLLPEGLSVDACEEDAIRQVPEKRLAECAECVEEESCETLQDACRSTCEPGD